MTGPEKPFLKLRDNITETIPKTEYIRICNSLIAENHTSGIATELLPINRTRRITMSVIHINQTNFNEEVLNSDKPVLLDFWAVWCGPCRMVSPVIDEIANEYAEIKVGKINVDEQQELAAQFQVMSIPTLVVVKNGKVVNQAVGARPKSQILEMF